MRYLVLLLLLVACQNASPPAHPSATIAGRRGQKVYCAKVPHGWMRIDPSPDQDLSNTMLPLCTFKRGEMTLTVHNFPSTTLEDRVPPLAQIERWKRQIGAKTSHIQPFAHGGFGGYRLEAYGEKEGKPIAIFGVSMQLTPLLYQNLSDGNEMRADYTLKAVGPPELLEAYRTEIDAFFESFELIEPIKKM